MIISIEQLELDELRSFLRKQADDAFPDLKDEERLNTLAEKWSNNAEFCTCRDSEAGLAGMITFYANRPEEAFVYIPHVYVNPEYRGRRIFSNMLHYTEEYVKNRGYRFMRLEVQKNNERAQKAYLNYGFLFIGTGTDNSFFMQYTINYDRM